MDGSDQIKRGVLWLGSASVVARLVDVGATLVVLGLLSQQEMGLGALVLSTVAVVESLSGLGLGAAIVQTRDLSSDEEQSLFWLTGGLGLLLGGLLALSSPLVAASYGESALVPLITAAGFKLLFVGIAVVPLQLMNKRLAFREVGAVQTLASLGEAVSKIALAAAGTGAWSLAGGSVARGFVLVAAVLAIAQFRPRLHFVLSETTRFVRFGLQVSGASVLQQTYRNADYFLVGKFLGIEALGLYRVAFDVAMQPTEAITAVVNRVGFPVYSRLAHHRAQLFDAFVASTRSFLLLVVPVAVFVLLAADDLLRALGDARWVDAIPALQVLAIAGVTRAITTMFPLLYLGVGRPKLAIADSLVTLVVLITGFWTALTQFQSAGLLSVCMVWLGAYPLLLVFHVLVTSQLLPFRLPDYLRSLMPGVGGGLCMAIGVQSVRSIWPPEQSIVLGLIAMAAAGLTSYVAYLRWVLKVRLGDLAPRASRAPDAPAT